MGQMAFSAGLSRHAFDAGEKWLGRIPGGLAAATVFGCAAFSTICGSSVATASTMARVAMPEMLRQGYAPRLAARSEEHTSELQSLMRLSYAVFCLKKKKN